MLKILQEIHKRRQKLNKLSKEELVETCLELELEHEYKNKSFYKGT